MDLTSTKEVDPASTKPTHPISPPIACTPPVETNPDTPPIETNPVIPLASTKPRRPANYIATEPNLADYLATEDVGPNLEDHLQHEETTF